ncbi:PilN domain-containing protein [Arenicella xantha]|uniref:Type IV pilus assembly protein PilN n=1 Tax=Arenicella xantha TaxID=644221 RepID=A0A395JM32_9GAMM|nr:PilN domain-containing protein [Arenicella xantha]RBP48840.1 type IV pilus assembly protein PilN [Arenicella xantha]
MANINLLPWREVQRRERNRATLVICIAMWVAAGLVVMAGKLIMDARISNQESRNAYLQSEINALAKVIKEIDDLKAKRDALLARMQVIQNLQQNRSQIVHMFDDLVNKLPKGVFYDRIARANNRLNIRGYAQSNERVSALMRNLDASDWFDQSSLKQVDVVDRSGLLVSQFVIDVKEQSGKVSKNDAEDIR